MQRNHGYRSRLVARTLAGAAVFVGACAGFHPVHGDALWSSPEWSLSGAAEGTIGHDTNVVARRDDVAASYVTAAPSLRLARRDSLTRFELTGEVEGTMFLSGPLRDSLDPSLELIVAHPQIDGTEPERELDAGWSRRDVTNTDLGRRVRTEEFHLRGRTLLHDTGRTRFAGGIAADSRDYDAADLNTNEGVVLAGDVGYAVTLDTHVGLGYAHEWGHSLGRGGRPDINRSQDQITLQARGRLLPKVTGTIFGGWAMIEYSDGLERTDDTWIGGASLDWEMSPIARATVRARRHADFDPQGETAIRSGVEIEMSRDFGLGWRLLAGGGASQLERTMETDLGTSTGFSTLVGVDYRLTERFTAGITHRYSQQYASDPELDYTRHQVEGRVSIIF